MEKSKKSPSGGKNTQGQPGWFDSLSTSRKDLICIGILYVIVLVLFHKIVFNNMIFSDSGDTTSSLSWVKAAEHIEQTEHIEPLWFPYVFGGMPGFGSLSFTPRDVNYAQQLIHLPGKLLFLNSKMSWVVLHYFLAGVFMFLLVRQLKFSQLPALIAALTLMMNPYAIGLAETGHGSKLIALSYVPLLFLLTHNLFERKNVLSLGLLAAAIGTQLLSNHIQIVFYSFLVLGCYLLYTIILDVRKEPALVLKRISLFVLALAIGFAISSYVYLSVQEYSHFSIRGSGEAGVQGGLSYDYATNWSFHPFEMMNYFIPSFFGFSSSYVTDYQGQQTALPLYWGWMPFTDSTMYIGIVPLLLGVLALLYKRERLTKFLGLLLIFVFLMAFGKHLSFLYDLMFNYFPFFNKFRVPAMILHFVPFIFGLLAAYGVSFLIGVHDREGTIDPAKLRKRFLYALGTLGGAFVIALVAKSGVYSFLSDFMFVKEGDLQQYGQQALTVLKEKRFEVLWSDYIKFTFFSIAFLGLITMYLNRKLRQSTFLFGMLALMIVDLYILDVKYISPKPDTSIEEHFQPDATVQFLKNDTTIYRIFPVGQLFQDNTYMYHAVQSMGGYSPAKLRIYQEMIDSCLYRSPDPAFPLNMNIVNMLNAKYIIASGRLPEGKFTLVNADQSKTLLTYLNNSFLPRAFFVDGAQTARSKGDVFRVLNSPAFDPRRMAVLEKDPSVVPQKSDSSSAEIVRYGAHDISIRTYTSNPSLLVVSEIYYPAGWKALIDGAETEIYKTNYILRSVVVPAGNHTVEFVFDPQTYHLGLTVTNISWGLTAALVLVGVIQIPQVRKRFGKKESV